MRWSKHIWTFGIPYQATTFLPWNRCNTIWTFSHSGRDPGSLHDVVYLVVSRLSFSSFLARQPVMTICQYNNVTNTSVQPSGWTSAAPNQCPVATQTTSLFSLRPSDCSGSALSQSPDPLALEASRHARSDSLVAFSSSSPATDLQHKSSQARCLEAKIGASGSE